MDTGRRSMVKYSALCSDGSDTIGDRPLMDTLTTKVRLPVVNVEDVGESKSAIAKTACSDCCSMIYKSDGSAPLRRIGEEDICGAGCVIVQGIRVPFPTCKMHSDPFTQK